MRTLRVIVTSIMLLLTGGTALAQDTEAVYDDPNGLFSVPIPTNWTAEPGDGFVTLSDPDAKILVYALVMEGDDVAKAIDDAWEKVAPDFTFKPQQTQEVPSAHGVEVTLVITALNDDRSRVFQGFGQLVDGKVYILLFDADVVAAAQRNAQIQIIATGFAIHALTKTDLTGIKPLALTDELVAQWETYISDTLEKLHVPGASVAVVQDGQIVYAKGFGVREMGREDPVTPETLMMIGSTTKSMTTLMMATLVDDGNMQWDQPVMDILPGFAVADPELSKTITVRNLVCACTGVPRRDMEWLFNTLTPEEIIDSLATFRFFTDFGEAFQYSNQMVAVGGYVAAKAAGGSGDLYEDYLAAMQERVFDAIGMPGTTFSFAQVEASADHATPHGQTLLGDYVVMSLQDEMGLIPMAPAGALWSNANDMARYVITELNKGVSPNGERVVSQRNLAVTWEPQVSITAEASYGLGWVVGQYKGLKVIEHGGNTFGFTSDLAFLPDANLGVVVLANARASNVFNQAVRFRLLELVFEQDHEYDQTVDFVLDAVADTIANTKKQLQQAIDAEAVAPFLGAFHNDILGDITLKLEGGRLLLDAGEFNSELRAAVNEKGDINYMTYDPPVAGLPFKLGDMNGKPVITLDIVTDQYVFRQTGQK